LVSLTTYCRCILSNRSIVLWREVILLHLLLLMLVFLWNKTSTSLYCLLIHVWILSVTKIGWHHLLRWNKVLLLRIGISGINLLLIIRVIRWSYLRLWCTHHHLVCRSNESWWRLLYHLLIHHWWRNLLLLLFPLRYEFLYCIIMWELIRILLLRSILCLLLIFLWWVVICWR
jgi:hypothetical protein